MKKNAKSLLLLFVGTNLPLTTILDFKIFLIFCLTVLQVVKVYVRVLAYFDTPPPPH